MRDLTDSVIVFYSGGKDSAVLLDLAVRHFKIVHPVFMYHVNGLSFQDTILKWAEKKYGVEIYRVPHFELSTMYRSGAFSKADRSVRQIKINDIYAHARDAFGCEWIAAGERCADSTIRNAMIRKTGPIDAGRHRFYPLAYWLKSHVVSYITQRKLMVSPESKTLGHSFAGIVPKDLAKIKVEYPEDYQRILSAFPLAEAAAIRHERTHEQPGHQAPTGAG